MVIYILGVDFSVLICSYQLKDCACLRPQRNRLQQHSSAEARGDATHRMEELVSPRNQESVFSILQQVNMWPKLPIHSRQDHGEQIHLLL